MAPRSIAEIFSERGALELYLRVEGELSLAEADVGIVPRGAAEDIARHCSLDAVDLELLREQTGKSGYPIAPLVRQLTIVCGEHGCWVHWGATTQDILNTALALQINESWRQLESIVRLLAARLMALTEEHRKSLMVARTFGGHALPITFGFKTAVWLSGVLRHLERIVRSGQSPVEGEFGGVAGTLASLSGRGLEVRRRLMERLGLPEPAITWSAMRDNAVERTAILANLTGTIAKIMQDVADLSGTEIAELAEPVSAGKDTSSALPYKANPVYCAQALAAATLVAQFAATTLQATRQHSERSGEGLLEFQTVPLVFVHAERCLQIAQFVMDGLRVFPARMRANVGLTGGIILAERYMMALAPYIGRLAAHDLLHEACCEAVEACADLPEVLASSPVAARHLGPETIHALADPETYTGEAQQMIDAVLSTARQLLAGAHQ